MLKRFKAITTPLLRKKNVKLRPEFAPTIFTEHQKDWKNVFSNELNLMHSEEMHL